jgi:hypothetical protein
VQLLPQLVVRVEGPYGSLQLTPHGADTVVSSGLLFLFLSRLTLIGDSCERRSGGHADREHAGRARQVALQSAEDCVFWTFRGRSVFRMLQPLIALALGDKSVSFGIRLFDSHAASVHPLVACRVDDDGESEPLLAQQEQQHEEGGKELEQQIKTGPPDLRREIESARQRLFTAVVRRSLWPRCTAWPWTTPCLCNEETLLF